ncbi:MAG TPA: lysophospholipid acyltransferase family protein [Acidimicrobiia bacterium]|jgi:1-acyl-sn-glycerol-3-phosphate acyltransferase|nr:lysophospholipid acyltransferase family protein [Acidimicrobiia bacterium]
MSQTVRAALRTAVAVPTFFLFTWAMAAAIIFMSFIDKDSPAIDSIIRFWSRLFLTTAPLSLEVHGSEHIDPSRQYVFVANHLSNFDIPVMFRTIPVPIRYLAKKEIYKIPLVAQAMNRIGIVKTDRQAGGAAHALINEGVAAAKARGHSLIIFPEGTRSKDGKLGGFKKGAFRIAIANQLPVIPITVQGTWEVWPPDAKMFFPGHAVTIVHDVIETEGMDLTQITELRDRCHAAVASVLPAEAIREP